MRWRWGSCAAGAEPGAALAARLATLAAKRRVGNLLKNSTATRRRRAYREVVAGRTAQSGGAAENTQSKMNLANAQARRRRRRRRRRVPDVVRGTRALRRIAREDTPEQRESGGLLEARHGGVDGGGGGLYREVMAGRGALRRIARANAEQDNLANLLAQQGTAASTAEADALYREVVAGETAHYGARTADTAEQAGLANLLRQGRQGRRRRRRCSTARWWQATRRTTCICRAKTRRAR